MSRKSCSLERNDVPKYIKEIVKRLYDGNHFIWKDSYFVNNRRDMCERDVEFNDYSPGYVFKLYGRRKIGAEIGSRNDAEKLVKWAKSWYADAKILEEHMWYNDVKCSDSDYPMTRTHRTKAYREGFRNYWIIKITDPVCLRFERDDFYRKEV